MDRKQKLNIFKNKGSTIIEVLISIFILFIVIISITSLITIFGLHIRNRVLLTCLVEGAASGIEACKNGYIINEIRCGGFTVNISVNGTCNLATNLCSDIEVIASSQGKVFSLKDKVCKF
ncbi:MAG: type pilus assembly protein PilA [Thermodesulfobacterium sp.]|nr:type pilus assembly protein PilA [Thermodesulfobacterium sp.]